MVRVGKWDEQKVLFKSRNDGGHDHAGGTRGAHITSLAFATAAIKANKSLGTGCIQVLNPRATLFSTNVAKRKMWYGMITKTRNAATQYTVTMGGATGFAALDFVRMHCRATRSLQLQTATNMFWNYTGRSTMLYVFLPASLGQGATASVFVEVFGRSA